MYSTIRFTSQGSNEVLSYILTYWNTILDFYQSIKSGFRGSHHCHQDLQGVLFLKGKSWFVDLKTPAVG